MCTRYEFVAPETFNVILDNYLERRSEKRKAKAFITREMYDLAVKILLTPNDVGLADKQHRHWVYNSCILFNKICFYLAS